MSFLVYLEYVALIPKPLKGLTILPAYHIEFALA